MFEELTAAQFLAFAAPRGVNTSPYDPDRVRAEINRRRLAKGLPPVKPGKRRN